MLFTRPNCCHSDRVLSLADKDKLTVAVGASEIDWQLSAAVWAKEGHCLTRESELNGHHTDMRTVSAESHRR